MIDTDTRQLKRNPDGMYRSGAGKIPCDHCGLNEDCQLKPRTLCDLFQPALPFQDETGLDWPSNTVRVGVAWTTRLLIGQRVALYNAKRKLIFGHSTVTGLFAGPIHEILAQHARHNHLMLDTPPADAARTLLKWQQQNYGPRIIHAKTRLTAIYIQRHDGEDAAADLGGHEALRLVEGGAPRPGEDHGDGGGHPLPDR